MATEPRRLSITLKSNVEKRDSGYQGDDIIDSVKKEIYEFAAKQTKDSKNEYPLTTEYGNDNSPSTPEGYTAPLTSPGDRNQAHYTKTLSPRLINELNQTSDSGVLSFQDDKFNIKKGKQNNNFKTADEYYRDLENNGDNSDISKRVKRTLLENGGYNEDKPYSSTVSRANEDENIVGSINLNQLGTASPRKFPDSSEAKDYNILKIKDLKKVGLQTLFGSSGELVKVDPNLTYADTLSQLAGTLPSLTRLGQKIPLKNILPSTAMERIKPGYVAKSDSEDAGSSYGGPNNPAVPFEAGNLAARALTYTALLTTFYGLLKATNTIANAIRKKYVPESSVRGYSRQERGQKRYLGSSIGNAGQPSLDFGMDFTETKNSYDACMEKGAEVFFGFSPTNITSIAGVTNQMNNITQGMTFYNVILVEILRSARDLSVGNLNNSSGGSFETEAVKTTSNIVQDIFSTVKQISNNKVIRFFDVLAQIGDIAIEAEARGAVIDATGFNTEEIESDSDRLSETIEVSLGNGASAQTVPNPAILPGKGRFRNGTHALRADSIKSLLTMPTGVAFANAQFGNKFTPSVLLDQTSFFIDDQSQNFDQQTGRIKQETVKKMEEYLEKDYMPFYFHDLRTNEIISFHAFINDISETFTADYNSVDGFGRMNPIQIYKNTTREISLGFSVVSFDDSDLDSLWYKINRFMMLLYPQWTKGREISIGDAGKMIQPFSQQIGASPLIRMRVGDLFKSNYSKAALARLFGLGSSRTPETNDDLRIGRFQENTAAVSNSRTAADNLRRQITATLARQRSFIFQPNDKVHITSGVSYIKVPPATNTASNNIPGRQRVPNRRVTPYIATGTEEITNLRISANSPNVFIGRVGGTDQEINIPRGNIIPDESLIRANTRTDTSSTEPQLQQTSQTDQDIQDFFSTEGQRVNPIVKAFESTSGTGLAGFIKSVSVAYPENATWVTGRYNSRVPSLIQISLTFSPIHDIEPGLDHNGFMRAPIWNVGNIIGKIFTDKDSFEARQQSLNQANQVFNRKDE